MTLHLDAPVPRFVPSRPSPITSWADVCALDEIAPDTGVAALIGDRQVAIFRYGTADTLYALDNFDPFGHAHVLARGIVGDRQGVPKVVSPLLKQSFDLRTGICLDDPTVTVASFAVRCRGGRVEVLGPS